MKLSVAFSRIHCRKSHLRRAVEIQGAQRVFYRPKSTQSALKRINTMSQDSVVRRFFRRAGDAASSSGVSKATMQLSSTILQDINKIVCTLTNTAKSRCKRQQSKILSIFSCPAPSVSWCCKGACEGNAEKWIHRICWWRSSHCGILSSKWRKCRQLFGASNTIFSLRLLRNGFNSWVL